ncbi:MULTISPECIES: hypothetical protein [Actinomycetes]|uniref:hypothetical protein n=1 Tax=Aeromicrobium tamlense TaxID=375541 RepID=UPI0031D9306A
MSGDWFDAHKPVQAKGPFYDETDAEKHGFEIGGWIETHPDQGFYVVIENDGTKRPIAASTFEAKYERGGGDETNG